MEISWGYVQQTLCQAVEASAKQIPNICRTHMEDLEKDRFVGKIIYLSQMMNIFFDLK